VTRPPGSLRALLEPNSIVIVGASARPGHFGNQPLVNLKTFGFKGEIFAVNPSQTEIEGVPCFPTIEDLPRAVDHAVIVLRSEQAADAVRACGRRGIPSATVVASGFAETGGEEGIRLQAELALAIADTGVRVCGPNTLGTANFASGAVPFVSGNLPPNSLGGGIAIVSQSGGIGFTILNRAYSRAIGAGQLVVAGNELDITIPDFINALASLDGVRAIACYIEAVRDAPGLIDAAANARRLGIPIVMMKTGRSLKGARAAAAHTGALATSSAVFDGVMRQAGVIMTANFDELIDTAALFARFGPSPRGGFGVYGMGGGLSVVLADLFENAGLDLAEPAPATKAAIKEILPDTTPGNPLDSGGQFLTAKGDPLLPPVLKLFADDPAFGALVYGCMPVLHTRERIYGEAITAAAAVVEKPSVALHYGAPGLTDGMVAALRLAGLLVFDPPEAGVRALRNWSLWRAGPAAVVPERRPADALLDKQVSALRTAGRRIITEYDAGALMRACGIPVAQSAIATSEDAAVAAAEGMGVAVVLKALSPEVTHRARAGVIALGVRGETGVRAAWHAITTRVAAIPGATLEGVLIQEMLPSGLELVAGLKRDPQFGPVVLLGLGGVLVERLNRVAIRRPPLDLAVVADMLDQAGIDDLVVEGEVDQLLVILNGLVTLAASGGGSVAEIDLNPILKGADGRLRAADALVVLAP
jgi:acetate---CoA ligase (ADP-forming)